jgi:hypothetical protein
VKCHKELRIITQTGKKLARPKAGWIDVNIDMRKESVKWMIEAKDGVGWQRILNEANAHLVL